MKLNSLKKVVFKSFTAMALTTVIAFFTPFTSLTANAEYYSVTAQSGVLLSCYGTEVFADADASTYLYSLDVNTPVQVTGFTSNGFWQVNINGTTAYIPQTSLSMAANTAAIRLTSYDVNAALVANASNGKLIYTQGATDRLEPASTTKIMTALLVAEAVESGQLTLDTPVAVSATAISSIPSDASHVSPKLQAGEVLTVGQLLQATMVSSDCHACNVLAEAVAGSVDNFVALMNTRAAQIGCVDTNFTNPSGYPDTNMYTNAYSLYLITANAIQHPVFNQYFGQASAVIPATNLCATPRNLVNSNATLVPGSTYYNSSVIGGKTGSASRAGQCLVTLASREGKTIITVVLGGKNRTLYDGTTISTRYYETNRLIELGFANYW